MRVRLPGVVWAAVFLLGAASAAAAQTAVGLAVEARADPDRAPADGKTPVVISVQVVDAFGRPAPDGTPVFFTTTLGEIVSPVQTLGGMAQTVLTPSTAAGTAIVSVVVASTRRTLEVEFLAAPGSAAPGSTLVELTADEISYSADQRVFIATWQARLIYQALEIEADGVQYDMPANTVRAQGNVVLRSGKRELRGDALRFELLSMRGRLLHVGDEVERLVVEGDGLATRPDDSADACLWEPLKTDETRTWVKAQHAIIDPGRKVVLDHAAFYVDDTRVLALRRHVLDPAKGGAVFGDVLGFSSADGFSLDVPYYFEATGNRVGSLHLTRNRAVSGGQYRLGWSVGLNESYMDGRRLEGSFALDDITDPWRAASWEHRQRLPGGAQLTMDANTLSFSDDQPEFRGASVNYSRPVSAGRFSLSLSGSRFGGSQQYYGDAGFRFRSSRLGGGVLMTPSLHLRHSRNEAQQDLLAGEILVDPNTGEPLQIARQTAWRTTSPGVDLDFDLPMRHLTPTTDLYASLRSGYAWGLANGSRGALDALVGMDFRLSQTNPLNRLSLSYTYSAAPAGIQPTLFESGRQLLSLRGTGEVKGATVHLSISQAIDGSRRFGSIGLIRPLPFGTDLLGRPLWSIEVSHLFSRLNAYQFASSRLALNRVIGRYRLSLCYSPQGVGDYGSRPWASPFGYGYSYSGGRHLWLEFAASVR